MRKFIAILLLLALSLVLLCSCSTNKPQSPTYLRIHIKANSDSSADQDIKLLVKDKLIDYLTPRLEDAVNSTSAEKIVAKHTENIKNMIDNFLFAHNFDYKCTVDIDTTFFPAKSYGDLVLDEGLYRAVIINLGAGAGENWWCVAFPPLCFLEGDEVIYKSKIWQIINDS